MQSVIFDPLYGFVRLTCVETEIIQSSFYQRLRWIKQLGLSCILFPGAEHSRFGHSIGVLHNAHKIIESCEIGVAETELLQKKMSQLGREGLFHQSVRLAALMHDLGTFPFSHTIESSYVQFGETTRQKGGKGLEDGHEHLGSYIIKNTDYEGGITFILKKYGLDPQTISNMVKGNDSSLLANQILHAEIDCDRMDYLLRDAHYTGLRYGAYDREYLLHHFVTTDIEGVPILALKHNAIHCLEDFLMARFAWYSQVIRSPKGARYDAVAAYLGLYFLENSFLIKFSELLDLIKHAPMKFFGFTDSYFFQRVHECFVLGALDKMPRIKALAQVFLLGKGAKIVQCKEFSQILLNQDQMPILEKHKKKAWDKFQELKQVVEKYGSSEDWIIPDIPEKEIVFISSLGKIKKAQGTRANLLTTRDPVKIYYGPGKVKLLVDIETSLMDRMQHTTNFIPNVFCSEGALKLLRERKLVDDEVI